ncbi:hypothetical protein [Paraburkholderia sp. C35]|uniref:hypothetical protein n=1 Tax=Paraburkholderia sp. C35 TaxID=2126993 RepID=UPI000D690F79|nr:hypothetical protein [Paraburkholderia sp. C35]
MARVEIIQFDNVPEDGLLDEHAFVPVDGLTQMSPPHCGCNPAGCTCPKGHYFTKLFPRDNDGTVRGYAVEFDSQEELEATGPEQIAKLVRQAMI